MSANTSLLVSLPAAEPAQKIAALSMQMGQDFATARPDLHFVNQPDETLQIADVRQLRQDVLLRPYQAEQSTFVIWHIEAASLPAQNALLKVLEEPPAHAQLILTTQNLTAVLPTIRSRCSVITQETPSFDLKPSSSGLTRGSTFSTFRHLLTATYTNIFAWSEQYKDRAEAQTMLQQLLSHLHTTNTATPSQHLVATIQLVLKTQTMLQQNVNVRLALEDLVLQARKLSNPS